MNQKKSNYPIYQPNIKNIEEGMKKSQQNFAARIEKINQQSFDSKSYKHKNQHLETEKLLDELPNIQDGITLDKYFGCNFSVVQPMKYDEQFGEKDSQDLDQSIEQYLQDQFEINEIDEDMYTESNLESNKNSRNQKRYFSKKLKKSNHENPSIISQHNQDIQQKIINKYKAQKNFTILKEDKSKIKINIKIEYPQQTFHSQIRKQSYNPSVSINDEFSNTLSSYQSINRNRSNSKENNIKNNDSFDLDLENHIVLRNTSSNIFRYSNYNKTFEDLQTHTQFGNQTINKQMPKIYYDNDQVINKFQKERNSIENKYLNKDQNIINKYAHRFNLNQNECYNLNENNVSLFQSIDQYKNKQQDVQNK